MNTLTIISHKLIITKFVINLIVINLISIILILLLNFLIKEGLKKIGIKTKTSTNFLILYLFLNIFLISNVVLINKEKPCEIQIKPKYDNLTMELHSSIFFTEKFKITKIKCNNEIFKKEKTVRIGCSELKIHASKNNTNQNISLKLKRDGYSMVSLSGISLISPVVERKKVFYPFVCDFFIPKDFEVVKRKKNKKIELIIQRKNQKK